VGNLGVLGGGKRDSRKRLKRVSKESQNEGKKLENFNKKYIWVRLIGWEILVKIYVKKRVIYT
jgi:hypothetical protein